MSLPATDRDPHYVGEQPPRGDLPISLGSFSGAALADHRRTYATRDEPFALLGERDALPFAHTRLGQDPFRCHPRRNKRDRRGQ